MNKTSVQTSDTKTLANAMLRAGLIIGLLDAVAAMVAAYFPKQISPLRVWQYVASGVFGTDAFAGGYTMMFAGLLFHFIIALGWTSLYFLLYWKMKLLQQNRVVNAIGGVLYGVGILLGMKFVVLPLSNVKMGNPGAIDLPQLFIHMFVIGLSIALLARRYYSRR